ncbi:heme-binding protein [Thalassobius vesicularis]|uniref:heme-binding protein n=1 Tax=Thalassobius vesicularis TaxID=1294297 RepID=UPI001FE85735|nr:heme-binding protein [Thalassobius vesicularis]
MKPVKPIMRSGHYYIRRRVPSRYASVEERTIVQLCLFTDSYELACRKSKADGVIVGAVGITGDTSDNDETCAVTAITAAGFVADPG